MIGLMGMLGAMTRSSSGLVFMLLALVDPVLHIGFIMRLGIRRREMKLQGVGFRDGLGVCLWALVRNFSHCFVSFRKFYESSQLTSFTAYNPQELIVVPNTWARTLGPVVFESHNDSGGHFMAHEKPEYLARDLKAMFGKGGGAFGVVEGKNGYDDVQARL